MGLRGGSTNEEVIYSLLSGPAGLIGGGGWLFPAAVISISRYIPFSDSSSGTVNCASFTNINPNSIVTPRQVYGSIPEGWHAGGHGW